MAGYVVGWTLSYIVLVGTDFQHYYEYLYLAWTSPGEIPSFINIGALLVSCFSVVVTWIVSRLRSRLLGSDAADASQ